jgi:hypothetical protein
MLDAGETIVPRTCPVHGIQRCRPLMLSDMNTGKKHPAPDSLDRGDWMLTGTGKAFYPLDPRADELDIIDIAHALSMQCRYGGHSKRFYSVAEHCVLMATAAPEPLKLAALMHDGSEGYLQDVIRPVKVHLTNYLSIEDKLMRVIADRFGFAWPLVPEIKVLDERMLGAEREQAVIFPKGKAWSQWKPVEPLDVTLRFWAPDAAFHEFMAAFYRYGGKS